MVACLVIPERSLSYYCCMELAVKPNIGCDFQAIIYQIGTDDHILIVPKCPGTRLSCNVGVNVRILLYHCVVHIMMAGKRWLYCMPGTDI